MTTNHETPANDLLAQRAWFFAKLHERRSRYPLIAVLFLVVAFNNIPGAQRGDGASIVAVVAAVAAGVIHIAMTPRKKGFTLGVHYELTRDGVTLQTEDDRPPTRIP